MNDLIGKLESYADFAAHDGGDIEADVIRQAVAELKKHRKFADTILQISWHGQDADGGTIQKAAVRAGLAEMIMAEHPCGENCMCANLLGEDDFPLECCRKTYGETDE